MSKKNIWILGGIIIIAVILISMKSLNKTSTSQNDLTIGYSALRISLPVFVAQEQGYFKSEGLNVKLERFDTAQPLMNSLVSGNVQVAGYTALPITYNAMIRSKTDLYYVTSMLEDQEHRISYLIVPTDTPSTFTISDLRGKKIGILPTVAYKAWIEQILTNNGVNPSEVEIVQIAPAVTPSALESGQVDALFTNDPAATTVLQQGIGRLLSNRVEVPDVLGEPFVFGSFNIRKDFADSNPEITRKVIAALDKAVVFVNDNPEQSKQMMKKYLHESQVPFVDFYPDALYQTTKETKPNDFQAVSDQYLNIGIIPESLSVTDLVK